MLWHLRNRQCGFESLRRYQTVGQAFLPVQLQWSPNRQTGMSVLHARVVQLAGDDRFKICTVWVRIPPRVPVQTIHCACSPIGRGGWLKISFMRGANLSTRTKDSGALGKPGSSRLIFNQEIGPALHRIFSLPFHSQFAIFSALLVQLVQDTALPTLRHRFESGTMLQFFTLL
jgi:hypothetical protein